MDTLNERDAALLKSILAKNDFSLITTSERRFLKARRSYLSSTQLEKYASIVGAIIPEKETENEEVMTYTEMLDAAKKLGFTGPAMPKKDALKAFLKEHKR